MNDTLRRGRSRTGDQADVWTHLAEKALYLEASSPTGAMRHTFEQHRAALDESVSSPAWSCSTARRRSRPCALEALDSRRHQPGTSAGDTLDGFVARVRAMHAEDYPAVGLGTEVRLEAKGLHGAMLIEEDRIIHLSVLASDRTVTPPG